MACTSFIELFRHYLADTMPPFQDLNQTGQRLIISWVHQLTGRQGWKAFHEFTQQYWVIYDG